MRKWPGAARTGQTCSVAVPCTRLELLTPSAVHLPRRRPPTRVFLVTTAKSAPGITMRTTANARNSAYFDHDMLATLPPGAVCIPRAFPAGPNRENWGLAPLGPPPAPPPV